MNETINLTKMDGTNIEATLICYFENVNNKKQYLYYTLNEISGTDSNSTVKIYCAKVRQNDPVLDEPINESTWEQLKGHMAEALKETLNPDIIFLPINSLTDKTIVSEKVIAMPVSYNYIAKHYKFYIDNISSDTNVIEPAPIDANPAQETELTEPIVTSSPSEEENNNVNEQAVVEPTVAPAEYSAPNEPVQIDESVNANPIDIAAIEQKYAKMIEDINKLKEQELEAVKRYNATIQLSSMHNEQHASYVQNEQTKEVVTPLPQNTFEPTPVEPTPIEPVAVEPAAPIPPQDIETNWFDMPIQ